MMRMLDSAAPIISMMFFKFVGKLPTLRVVASFSRRLNPALDFAHAFFFIARVQELHNGEGGGQKRQNVLSDPLWDPRK
jgi:hypothetical protein